MSKEPIKTGVAKVCPMDYHALEARLDRYEAAEEFKLDLLMYLAEDLGKNVEQGYVLATPDKVPFEQLIKFAMERKARACLLYTSPSPRD